MYVKKERQFGVGIIPLKIVQLLYFSQIAWANFQHGFNVTFLGGISVSYFNYTQAITFTTVKI